MARAAATAALATLLLCIITAHYGTCLSVTPPFGNSVFLSATAHNGKATYHCNDYGKWVPASIAAELVATGNSMQKVGSYFRMLTSVADGNDVGTWTLLNNDGDAAESGHLSSKVAAMGNNNSELYLQNFLAQASHHEFVGAAARLSFIVQTSTNRSALPGCGCTCTKGTTVNVTYMAHFQFWNQDVVPPASIPPSIAVNSHQEMLLEAFFAVGRVAYKARNVHNAPTWEMQGAEGLLFDVPGGGSLGSLHLQGNLYRSKYMLCLLLNRSPPASTCAKPLTPNGGPVVIDPYSLPWSRMSVTNTKGNL
ncbi:hypothetical protein L7F22_040165 [Adiantum nelumboides]|nr:hypothetical protein [Adiantum nelumboides]